MELENVFSAVSTLSFLSWIALIIFYRNPKVYGYLFSITLIIFACIYSYFIFTGFDWRQMENFQTLSGIKELFGSDEALLAGWIHYLAFDLFVGMWIAKDAASKNINRMVLLPFLLFTFMMGPLGWFMYFIFQTFRTKKYFKNPFPVTNREEIE